MPLKRYLLLGLLMMMLMPASFAQTLALLPFYAIHYLSMLWIDWGDA